ncbi:MAG: CPBP family intramembrane metalloprotease [Spirochaetota bacterium]|nr:MAG: CPBP family intramembrane metalloprotease [Spirochaetota bacterium]
MAQNDTGSSEIQQYSLAMIILMFVWPAAWYMLLIHLIVPLFYSPTPGEFLPTSIFLAVITLGGGAELVVALILLRREGFKLTYSGLRERVRLRWPAGWKKWILAIVVFIVAFALTMVIGRLNKVLATVPGFIPPAWWPPMSNPIAEIKSVSDVFPDIILTGNYLFLAVFFVIGLVFNIIGEELYYRGLLLPKMRGVFGKWDWVANGIGFCLKHIYQRWVYPGILAGSICFAFVAGPMGSLLLAMIFHWVGNFLFAFVQLIPAVFGAG